MKFNKASKENNLNFITPELLKGIPVYNALLENPEKEEQILAKKTCFKINY